MTLNYNNELAELRVIDHLGSMAAQPPRSRRLGLWQIDGGPQCSIIGTCLSHQDLRAAICKHRLSVDANASSYDIHSHCVRVAQTDCPLSRTLTKVVGGYRRGEMSLLPRVRAIAPRSKLKR